MDNEPEAQVDAVEEVDEGKDLDTELQETTDWKAEAQRFKGMASRYRSKFLKATEKKAEPTSKSEDTKPADTSLLQKSFLRAAGISHADDVELALKTAKKWGVEVDQLVDDDDFQAKLEKQRTARTNQAAATHIKGDGSGSSSAKGADFFIARGAPPTREEVPDRAERAKIARAMMGSTKNTKKFFND